MFATPIVLLKSSAGNINKVLQQLLLPQDRLESGTPSQQAGATGYVAEFQIRNLTRVFHFLCHCPNHQAIE